MLPMVFDTQVDGSTAELSTVDERLLAVLAAAAPFDERAAGEYFTPVRRPGRQRLAKRMNRWLRAAVGDDPAAQRALLLHRRRTGRDFGTGLVDVVVRDPDRLPDWARAFVAFLDAQPATAAVDPACEMVGGAFVAFQRAAARLVGLRPTGTTIAGLALTDRAADQVAGQLVERLTAGCHAALAFELQVAEASATPVDWFGRADIDVSRNGWLARAESLPGLAYVVGVTCLQWQRTVTELFGRLCTDLPLLRRELWDWADPGPLATYSGDSGDLHHRGRVVTVLGFAGGQHVVYKPKDLSSAAGFVDVLTFLNRHGLPLELATRKVLCRGGYGWEEFVAAAPDVDAAGAGRFYTRLGMLARLAEFLECRDLWLDNLVAAGEQPVFIDLETVLQGRMRQPATIGTRAAALWDRVEETVAKTATVSALRPVAPGRRAQDIGCCASIQEQLAVDADGFPVGWQVPPYRPVVDGVRVDPAAYADDVLAGYRAMQGCLVANGEALADPRGPLGMLATAPVRYIWRSTWDYQATLRSSIGPIALTDGVDRELVLARLFRGALEFLRTDPDRRDVLELVEAEIDAIRRLDIPLLLSRPDSDAAFTPDDGRVEGHFAGTAWQRLQARIAALAEGGVVDDGPLATCLDIAAGGAPVWRPAQDDLDGDVDAKRRGIAVYHPARADVRIPHDELLAAACEVGESIVDAAVPVGPDRYGWIGVVHYPAHGLDQLEPLHGDLLTGTAGIAVFLAELFRTVGQPAYWTHAHDALAATREFVEAAVGSVQYRRMCGGPPVGAFVGVGAAIYAYARCAQVLGEPDLAAEAAALLPLARRALAAGPPADPVLGRAGLLLALRKLRTVRPGPDVDDLIATARRGLVPADTMRYPSLHGVPDGPDGVAAALAALDEAPEGHSFDTERVGGLLAAAATAAVSGTAPPDAVGAALRRPTGELRGAELLAHADLGLLAHRAGGATGYVLAAHRYTRALLSRRATTGRWFPDRRRPDRLTLSAVDGIAAVGLTCLALAEDEVTSLRTIG